MPEPGWSFDPEHSVMTVHADNAVDATRTAIKHIDESVEPPENMVSTYTEWVHDEVYEVRLTHA